MAVFGGQTMWPPEGLTRYTDVSSGTSYTIALVEAGHRTNNWMQPDDLSYAELLNVDRSSLSELHGGKYFAVCMVDGNAHLMQAATSPKSLQDYASIE